MKRNDWIDKWASELSCIMIFDSLYVNISQEQIEMSGAMAIALVRRLKNLGKLPRK